MKGKRAIFSNVQAINSEDLPMKLRDALIDAENEENLISVSDDGSSLAEWLKSKGFVFNMPDHLTNSSSRWGWLAIWW